MNPNDPNVAMMAVVAERLGERLRDELVFVGGAVAGLLITDPGQPTIRPTEDVDLIVHAATRADYQRVEEDYLRERIGNLLVTPAFRAALPGHLPGDAASQARLPDLEEKLHLLAELE